MFYLELVEASEKEKNGTKAILKYVNYDTNLVEGINVLSDYTAEDIIKCSRDDLCQVNRILSVLDTRIDRLRDVFRNGYEYERQIYQYADLISQTDATWWLEPDSNHNLILYIDDSKISQEERDFFTSLPFTFPHNTHIPEEAQLIDSRYTVPDDLLKICYADAMEDLRLLSTLLQADDFIMIDKNLFTLIEEADCLFDFEKFE